MLAFLPAFLQPYAKAAVAAVGVLAQLVALGVLPEKYQHLATVVLAAATALGVYVQTNEPALPSNVADGGELV